MSEKEQERRETLTNVLVEYRRDYEDIKAKRLYLPTAEYLRILLDRIEAAWNLEVKPTAEESSAFGNAAAIREALRALRQRFDNNIMAYQDRYFKFSGWHWHKKAAEAARWRDVFSDLKDVCDAALSAPARNCDLYDNWYDAHQAWERLPKDELGYFVAANGVHECEQAWLLATAAERKGEN